VLCQIDEIRGQQSYWYSGAFGGIRMTWFWRHWNDMVSTGTRPTTDVIKAKIKEEHDA
jgi:hypothetical protein